jgi:peptidylprolyl isomerase
LGTGTAPTAGTGQSLADTAALAGIRVDGDPGAIPTLAFDMPFEVTAFTVRLFEDGTGEELQTGWRVDVHIAEFSGTDGTLSGSTWDTGQTQRITLDDSLNPLLGSFLLGAHVGARLLIAAPLGDGTTVIDFLEVVSATPPPPPPLDAVQGEEVTPAAGLPTVTIDAATGAPLIDIPAGYTPPAELVVQPLIQGDGAVLAAADTIVAHYTGWSLDGTKFDSSWDRGSPSTFSLQGVIAGWTQGLTGQTVGSRVLLVIPSDLAYGDAPTGGRPAGPLIFVVDILGIG